MATPGTNARIYCDGFNLSGFLRGLTVSGSADVANIETFGDTYKRYQATLKDAVISFEGLLATDDDEIDEILDARLGVDGILVTVAVAGDSDGNVAYGLITSGTAYEINPAVDGVVGITASLQSSVGKERLIIYHASAEEDTETEGTGVDGGAGSTAGAVAYLQVLEFDGNDVTITIDDSDDDDDVDPYAPLITFTEVTAAPFAERVAVIGAVKQFTRWAIAGTFTTVTFQLSFARL